MGDIPASEVKSAKNNLDDFQMKCFVGPFPAKFKAGPQNTLEETRVVINTFYDSLLHFPGPSEDVPIVENEIAEEDAS